MYLFFTNMMHVDLPGRPTGSRTDLTHVGGLEFTENVASFLTSSIWRVTVYTTGVLHRRISQL